MFYQHLIIFYKFFDDKLSNDVIKYYLYFRTKSILFDEKLKYVKQFTYFAKN